MKLIDNLFPKIISLENLFLAWEEFKKGKQHKADVGHFEFQLEHNIFKLHHQLADKTYQHGHYSDFYIRDPKVRHIHKALVKDRILHHAVFRILNPVFDKAFIPNSFSCRLGKGAHKGVKAVERMIRKESENYTKQCFVLKCDVKKFFASVNHQILTDILRKKIKDKDLIWLLNEIVGSFSPEDIDFIEKRGLPIGNLTSQLFANIYLNKLDQFVKNDLKIKHYARYTDDFVVISEDKSYLESLLKPIQDFLENTLKLQLHPNKVSIRKISWGTDFLGYVILPHYLQLRTKTKHRIIRKTKDRIEEYKKGQINETTLNQSLNSYLGVLSHAKMHGFSGKFLNQYWFWLNE